MAELRLHEATFRAFGSNCRIVCDLQPSLMSAVHRLEDLEDRWSRFRPTSEVSAVNRLAGDWCEVSAATIELFRRAGQAREMTGGIVNPLMLTQLQSLGYRDSHEQLQLTRDEPTDRPARSASPASSGSIDFDGGAVRIPEGCGFDPGGIGKGMASDLLVDEMLDSGATWAMVSLGGDIRFGGGALAATGLTVHVDDPRNLGRILGATRVVGGALATSSTTARRWVVGDDVNHHLLDPRTGAPARSNRIAASVYAPTAWMADVIAKALVIDRSLGRDDLVRWNAEAIAFTNIDVVELGLPVEPLVQEVAA